MTETTKAAQSRTLAAKLAAAVADVGGKLKADKRNSEQGYNYISADKVHSVGGQALAERGISIIPQVTGTEMLWYDRGNGKGRWDAHLTMVMLITDGESEILAPWAGWGSDYAVPDKAAYKALTSGYKYFQMKLLSIGEGNEDSEHDGDETDKPSGRPAQRQTPAQAVHSPEPATQPEAPKNGNGQIPEAERPDAKLLKRWGELYAEAQAWGIVVDAIDPAKITSAELIKRGKALKLQIEQAEAADAAARAEMTEGAE